MPTRRLPFLFLLLAVGAVLAYSLWPDSPVAPPATAAPDYATERAERDAAWRTGVDSPLPDSLRARFRGFTWFAPLDSARVTARFDPFTTPEALLVPFHNAEAPEPFVRVARLTFELGGRRCTLTALRRPTEPPTAPLFVPFTDATSGHQTYGGGRYLDVAPPPAGQTTVLLDFNRALAPTCAHVPDYVCPLPPAENSLSVAVRAGERTP